MYLKEIVCEGARLIQLTQDRVQWQALVKTVMKSQVLIKGGVMTS
jgi:hypothetical protein